MECHEHEVVEACKVSYSRSVYLLEVACSQNFSKILISDRSIIFLDIIWRVTGAVLHHAYAEGVWWLGCSTQSSAGWLSDLVGSCPVLG